MAAEFGSPDPAEPRFRPRTTRPVDVLLVVLLLGLEAAWIAGLVFLGIRFFGG